MDSLAKARSTLLASAMILLVIGIVMIYSASAIYALEQMKDSAYFLKRHLIYLAMGTVLALLAVSADLEGLRRHSKRIFTVALVLMVLVLIPHVGAAAGGARRWFKILGFSFQPSEFLKIAVLFYMADFLDRKRESLGDMKHTVLPAFFVLGMSSGLLLKQPDLGTAVTIASVVFIQLFAAGFNVKYLLGVVGAGVPALCLAVLSKSYRRKRILAFIRPWDDPRGVGFQITQSFIALGSGGLFGVGLGRSQQKLFYLPASHTDFIFSIIGEELGFLGASSVVLLFIVFIFCGMAIVFRSKNCFRQLFGLGLVSLIGFEAVINIGVSTGALPTKGLSLPFISYGGSALLANMAALGFLLNLARETAPEPGAATEAGT